jgi:hypothetical protein
MRLPLLTHIDLIPLFERRTDFISMTATIFIKDSRIKRRMRYVFLLSQLRTHFTFNTNILPLEEMVQMKIVKGT